MYCTHAMSSPAECLPADHPAWSSSLVCTCEKLKLAQARFDVCKREFSDAVAATITYSTTIQPLPMTEDNVATVQDPLLFYGDGIVKASVNVRESLAHVLECSAQVMAQRAMHPDKEAPLADGVCAICAACYVRRVAAEAVSTDGPPSRQTSSEPEK